MSAPSCLRCDRPFPPNLELSLLPEGRRIAMDAERGRLWRICESCGEWNLQSAEVASRAIPELQRIASGVSTETLDVGLSRSRKGHLEILNVGIQPGSSQDTGIVARQEKVSKRQNRVALAGLVGVVATLTLPLWSGAGKAVAGGMTLRHIAGLCSTLWSAQLIARIPRVRRLGRGKGTVEFFLGTAMLAAACVAAIDGQELGMFLTTWAVLAPLWVWIDSGLPFGRTRLPSGGTVWIRRREMDETRCWIDDTGSIRLTLPNGRRLDVDDSRAVLRDLLDGYSWETHSDAQKVAATLVQGREPLANILEILRPALEVDPAGLPLAQLPSTWRAALDLALSANQGVPGRLSALAERAREAQVVAEIAESLDPRSA